MPNLFSSKEFAELPYAERIQREAERQWAVNGEEDVTEDGTTFHWNLCAYCDQPYKSFPLAHRGTVICNRCYFGR